MVENIVIIIFTEQKPHGVRGNVRGSIVYSMGYPIKNYQMTKWEILCMVVPFKVLTEWRSEVVQETEQETQTWKRCNYG